MLGILVAGERWSGGCGSRVRRREEKVEGSWQRERKQRPIESSVQDDVCEILGCISSDWHMLGTELLLSE